MMARYVGRFRACAGYTHFVVYEYGRDDVEGILASYARDAWERSMLDMDNPPATAVLFKSVELAEAFAVQIGKARVGALKPETE